MSREEQVAIFSSFKNSLRSFLAAEKPSEKHKKSTLSHRMATILSENFQGCSVDIDMDGTDILVMRGKKKILAIFWSQNYVTDETKKRALDYHEKKKPSLTLAFSVLPERNWILIYRFEEDGVQYMHIDKNTFKEKVSMEKLINAEARDNAQLTLFSKGRKKPIPKNR